MPVILLVRHGQASFGKSDYDELSALGVQQATALGATLKGRTFHRVVAGAMKRHKQTAEACVPDAMLEIDPGWNEYDHEAVIRAHDPDPSHGFQQMFAAAVAKWMRGGDYPETYAAFRARTTDAVRRLASALGKGETAIVFTSGGPISAVCSELLGIPDDRSLALQWTLVNASLSKLLVRGDEITVSSLNEQAHVEGPLLTYR